jgi:hypothetical protein
MFMELTISGSESAANCHWLGAFKVLPGWLSDAKTFIYNKLWVLLLSLKGLAPALLLARLPGSHRVARAAQVAAAEPDSH